MIQSDLTEESKKQRGFVESNIVQEAEVYYQKRYEELKQRYEIESQQLIEFKAQAHYWKAQFEQLKSKQKELEAKVEKLSADLKKREQQLFGKKSEKQSSKNEQNEFEPPKRKRGQQHGSKGHGRREHSNLPKVVEAIELSEKQRCCPYCHLPYQELSVTEDSEIVEVNVSAYTRLIKRTKYKRHCNCKDNHDPQIVTSPAVGKVLPKSKIGISIWALLLLSKYEYNQSLNQSLEQLSCRGLSLALGTVTDGFQNLTPLFSPIYDAFVERSLEAKHWHADETSWKVFEKIEDKSNSKWYLWVFQNKETAVFKIAPTRSSKVLIEHFGEDHDGGTLNVDRYSAYKTIAKTGLFILAFCWAHVRRDFLRYCKSYPKLEEWGLCWIKDIAKLYHINNLRTQYREKSKTFRHYHEQLRKAILQMREKLDKELTDEATVPAAKKILESLDNHWGGLTVFLDYSQIPMDNNVAERGLRPSVVGRKNYYGSGAVWSARLAAYLFTIFRTVKLWGINPQTWLLSYLQECASHGGNKSADFDKFVPWKMTKEQKEILGKPPDIKLPPNLEYPTTDVTG